MWGAGLAKVRKTERERERGKEREREREGERERGRTDRRCHGCRQTQTGRQTDGKFTRVAGTHNRKKVENLMPCIRRSDVWAGDA